MWWWWLPEAVSQTLTFPQWEGSWFSFLLGSIFNSSLVRRQTQFRALSKFAFPGCFLIVKLLPLPLIALIIITLINICFSYHSSLVCRLPLQAGSGRFFFCIFQEKKEFPLYFFAVCTSRELFACLVNGLLPNFSFSFFLCFMWVIVPCQLNPVTVQYTLSSGRPPAPPSYHHHHHMQSLLLLHNVDIQTHCDIWARSKDVSTFPIICLVSRELLASVGAGAACLCPRQCQVCLCVSMSTSLSFSTLLDMYGESTFFCLSWVE